MQLPLQSEAVRRGSLAIRSLELPERLAPLATPVRAQLLMVRDAACYQMCTRVLHGDPDMCAFFCEPRRVASMNPTWRSNY